MNSIRKQCVRLCGLLFLVGMFWVWGDVSVVHATTPPTDFGISAIDPVIELEATNIIEIILNIIRVVLGLVGIILLGLILYAGFIWMTSEGNPEKITTAKRTMINAVIGLAIIMSAFAIVSFVIRALSDATGLTGGREPGGGAPLFNTFIGSGALGNEIVDHYPFRNAQDVPRNTRIAITFRESLDPSTIMENTNNTCFTADNEIVNCADDNADTDRPVYGDCITPSAGTSFDWRTMCDRLVTSSIHIFEADDEDKAAIQGAVMAVYEDAAKTQIQTITIRPYEPLGNAIDKVWYRVEITNDVRNIDGDRIFRSGRRSSYAWEFQTDTLLDLSPPRITSTYPADDGEIAKNTIISMTFNKAVDPVMVQGFINAGAYPFTNIIFDDTDIQGQWRVSNGYRTVEFIPSTVCGEVNSCGEVMYCLPVTGESELYTTLVRTAERISQDSWEAFPFSGVYDMSGNALDDGDGVRGAFPNPPRPDELETLDEDTELVPDNYHWEYTVKNEIDRRIPYPYQITPGVDSAGIKGNTPVHITFNMPMYVETLFRDAKNSNTSTIRIEEYPTPPNVETIWVRPDASMGAVSSSIFDSTATGLRDVTKAQLLHREFGPNNTDFYYFTSITGGVRGVNQNCMYPGYGPVGVSGATNLTCVVSDDGTLTNPHTCVPVTADDTARDTGCAFHRILSGSSLQAVTSTADCLVILRADSPEYTPPSPNP